MASDLDNEDELREWLSSTQVKGKGVLPGEVLVKKFLPPGTVADLYEHYKATQSMLGGYAVSHFSWYLKLTVSGHSPSSQSSCVGVGWIYLFHPISYFLFPGNTCACLRYGTFLDVYKRRWSDILGFRSRSLFTSCEVCFALKQALGDKNNTLEGKTGGVKAISCTLALSVLRSNCDLAVASRVLWTKFWNFTH